MKDIYFVKNVYIHLFVSILIISQGNYYGRIINKREKNLKKEAKKYELYVYNNIEGNFVNNASHQYGFDDVTIGKNPVYLSIIPKSEGHVTFERKPISYNNEFYGLPKDKYVFFKMDSSSSNYNPKQTRAENTAIDFVMPGNGDFGLKAMYDHRKELAKAIIFSHVMVTKKVALHIVHSNTYTTNITINEQNIKASLNQIYKPSCIKFKVFKLQDLTIDFDINQDKKIDVTFWNSNEMKIIRNHNIPKNEKQEYDYILFFVSNPLVTNNLGAGNYEQCGMMDIKQEFGFLFCNDTQVIAHELGHGQGLSHTDNPSNDRYNLMNENVASGQNQLRYQQWKILHQ